MQTGQWTATDAGIGAGVDSYFEYLSKAAVLFNRPELMRQFKCKCLALTTNAGVFLSEWPGSGIIQGFQL